MLADSSSTHTGPLASSKAQIYTCPMHAEVRHQGPGVCPICGMALEPRAVTAHEDTGDADRMSRRFWLSVCFTLPLLLLSMTQPMWTTSFLQWTEAFTGWLEAALASIVVLGTGWPLLERAARSLRSRHLNMFSLIGVGVGASFMFSLFALIAPKHMPVAFLVNGRVPLYFEPAAVITTLVLLGQMLELRARSKTGSAIRSLLALAPDSATLVTSGTPDRVIPLSQVKVGDHLRILPGARIPADGEVVSGSSNVDESMMSGEPLPKDKHPGDKLKAGTQNSTGSLVMLANQVGSETLLARIVALVNDASRSQGRSQNLADKIAAWFVPCVFAAAVVTFLAWAVFGPEPNLSNAFVAAVSVLIVACPCALGLATPISIMAAMGWGAQQGVLIKSAQALEVMNKIDTLVIDKTGTLTEGRPEVQRFEVVAALDRTHLLDMIYSVEQQSEHPLAASILRYASQHNAKNQQVFDFCAHPGLGVTATVGGLPIVLGNARMMDQMKIDIVDVKRLPQTGESVIFVGYNLAYAGLVGVMDTVRKNSRIAVKELQQLGIEVILATGDNATTAGLVARQVGIDDVKAEILPQGKHRVVTDLQAKHRIVAMAGDGINDAPALAQADVGIAMGTGADIAMQSASIVLVGGDLMGIVKARVLSQRTLRNIRENLGFAFAYNLLGVPVAAGVLFPTFGILLSPMAASAAMAFSSICVITNALRLRHIKFDVALSPDQPAKA